MKNLYGKYERYTEAASKLDREIHKALKPIFDKYIEEGYAVREISHVAHSSLLMLECEKVMRRTIAIRQQEKAAKQAQNDLAKV